MLRLGRKTRVFNAIIAGLIILTLISGDFLLMGKEVFAATDVKTLDTQTEDTLNKNIKFDTFFEKDNEKTHYLTCDVNNNENMNIKLTVKEGYLKNAYLEFEDKNYVINEIVDAKQIVQKAEDNKIALKQIDANMEAYDLTLKIAAKLDEKINLKDLNKESKVILKAIYMNSEGKEQTIEKDIKVNIKFEQKVQAELAQVVNSYFAFKKEQSEKILVKYDVKLNLKGLERNLPIESTQIIVKIPTLNGVKPESATIAPKNTKMTNGQEEENVVYTKDQILNRQEEGILAIRIDNKEENGKVFTANGQDEYTITYIYPKTANSEIQTITSDVLAVLKPYSGEQMITTQNQIQTQLTEEIGKPLSFEVSTENGSINKGKLYANTKIAEKQYETEYSTEWKIDVSGKDVLDGIRIEDRSEYFTDSDGNKFLTVNFFDSYTHYTKTIISKNNFENILGKEGYINIFNQSGQLLNKIDINTVTDSNNNFVIGYTEETDKIIMETSKPLAEGTLYVKNTRVVEENIPYTNEQMRTFKNLEIKTNLIQILNNEYRTVEENTLKYALEETTTNANIVLNKTVLSTIVTNEDVELKIELDNNRESSDLYENPVFMVELPEYVEDITVKSANIAFDEDLKIQNVEKIELDGKFFLRITVEGVQKGFSSGKFTKGTNIVLNTDIKAKLLTPNKQDQIKLYYLNPNAITYENSTTLGTQVLGQANEEISYSAPVGMLAVSSISNYENTGKIVTSVYQGTITDKISILDNAKLVKTDLTLVNNTGNVCNNIVAIGRIPFKGNKDIGTGEELGTTIDTVLKSNLVANGIEQDKVLVYYSENGDAGTDINDINNAWTLEPQDLSKVKSYLIVIKDYQMNPGEVIKFTYDSEIPANLDYGNDLYNSFGVTYLNNSEVGIKEETTIAATVGLKTGEGPHLDVSQYIDAENNTVTEGQTVKVVVDIINTGSTDVEDVVLREYIPQFTKYTEFIDAEGGMTGIESGYIYPQTKIEDGTNREFIDFEIGKMASGEVVTVDFELYVDKVQKNAQDEDVKLVNEMSVFAKDLEKAITIKDEKTSMKNAYLLIEDDPSEESARALEPGEELSYNISVRNKSENTLTGVVAKKVLPSSIEYKNAYITKYNGDTDEWDNLGNATYDENTKTVTWNIGTMSANETKRLKLIVKIADLEDKIYQKQIKTRTEVNADGIDTHYSLYTKNIAAVPHLVATIESDQEKEYIAEGDKITYKITVTNAGRTVAKNVKFEDVLPKELKLIEGTFIQKETGMIGTLLSDNNDVTLTSNMMPGDIITIRMIVEARNLPNSSQEETVKNYATFMGENTNIAITDVIITRIEQAKDLPNPPEKNTNSNSGSNTNPNSNSGTQGNNTNGTTNVEKTFRIRGLAWIDSNANGIRDSAEKILGGVSVELKNAITGEIVKDKDSGIEKKTTTANDGSYVFENLAEGDYTVIVYYDNITYRVTDYQKTGVADSQNSDFVSTKINQDGEEIEVAVSDTIRLRASSYSNIDIGLINNKQFDLKLDKYITKVTVQNKEGVKSYDYNNSTLAKVDLTAKKMVGSTIVTEYKFKITNEGNIPGYAKNIVDYLPSQMKFNSSLNPRWYAGNDGYLYNTELANQLISPGETKEISLVLTSQVADTSSMIVNNKAEIYEDYNDLGIADTDSQIRNRAQGEDDLGTADLIITIKTGAVVTYTVVTLITLIIAACGIYVIRKKISKYYN